jgi:hypothetical protein
MRLPILALSWEVTLEALGARTSSGAVICPICAAPWAALWTARLLPDSCWGSLLTDGGVVDGTSCVVVAEWVAMVDGCGSRGQGEGRTAAPGRGMVHGCGIPGA